MTKKYTLIIIFALLFIISPISTNAQSCSCTCRGTNTGNVYREVIDPGSCGTNFFPECQSGGCTIQDPEPPDCICQPNASGSCTPTGERWFNNDPPCCSGLSPMPPNFLCTDTSQVDYRLSTPPPFDLCKNTGDQETDCLNCYKNGAPDGGIWTGLGCIRFNPKEFIVDFLKIAIGIAGGIALLLMGYGSFLISTSAGDPKKAEEGKEIITGTIAGLLFIIFSVVLLNFIGVQILRIPGL